MRHEENPSLAQVHAARTGKFDDIFLDASAGRFHVVRIAKGKQIKPVPAKEPKLLGERLDRIEIEAEHEDLIEEPVLFRLKPVMHHIAFIEAGS